MNWTFLAHLFATLFMTGLIWFVQIVHYPLMGKVGPDVFAEYEQHHQQLTTYVVMPMMLLEIGTAFLLLFFAAQTPAFVQLFWANAILLVLVWASTFFIQVPLHTQLNYGFATEAHQKLVTTNWIRTALWTLRAGLLLWVLWRQLSKF